MNKLYLLLAALLIIPAANAINLGNFENAYTFNDTMADYNQKRNLSASGTPAYIAGKYNNSYDGAFSAWGANTSQDMALGSGSSYTVAFWTRKQANPGSYYTIFGFGDDDQDRNVTIRWLSNGSMELRSCRTGTACDQSWTPALSINSWHHVTYVHDVTNGRNIVYINGTSSINITRTAGAGGAAQNDCFGVGIIPTTCTANSPGAYVDVTLWYPNRTLTQEEALYLYNSSIEIPLNNASDTFFQITAADQYDGTSLTSFLANVTYSGTTASYSTSNGTINFNFSNNAGLINATVYNNTYYAKTYTNYNVSTNLGATLFQAQLTLGAFEVVTNSSVTTFTATAPLQSNTSTNPVLYLKAGTYSITFNKTGWFNKTQSFTVTAQTNTTQNFTNVYQTILNITARNNITGEVITNFTITAASGSYTYTATNNTNNNYSHIPWTSSDTNANLSFNSSGYANATILINVSGLGYQNYTFSIFTTRSIYFRFYDEQNNTLLNATTVTAYLTSSSASYNFTTTNGTKYIDLLTPATYTISYSAPGYSQREYEYTVTSDSTVSLDLYLLSSAEDDLVLATVFDTSSARVEDAQIVLQKKNLSGTNYYTVETCNTNVLGECLLHIELYETTYRFVINYNGETKLNSGDTKVSSTTLSFIINIQDSLLETYYDLNSIGYSLTYDTTTDQFSYTWTDYNGNAQRGCLVITSRSGDAETTRNTTCTTSSTGTLTYIVNETLYDEWTASGYVILTDGTQLLLDTMSIVTNALKGALNKNGLFLFGFLAIGTLAFTGLYNPIIPPILIAFGAFLFNSLGLISIGTTGVISLAAIAMILLYTMKNS